MTNGTIEDLIKKWGAKLRDAFLHAIRLIRDGAIIDLIANFLRKGDIDGALKAVGIDPLAYGALATTVEQAFDAGGNFAAGQIPAVRIDSGHVLKIRFDARNIAAETWLKDHSSTMITEIVADQNLAVRAFLVDGMAKGVNPKTVALDVVGRISAVTGKREGGVAGLTSGQEVWARNYAAEVASANPAALNRNLRDRRFDAAVNKAIASGKPIPADLQVKMVTAYRNRALRYRGETIGRTEALTSLHVAGNNAMQQGIAKGQVKVENIVKIWHSAADDRVRDTHRAMNGMKVKFRDDFVSPSGARLQYPGDPSAPAAESINCRCHLSYRVDHLAGLK